MGRIVTAAAVVMMALATTAVAQPAPDAATDTAKKKDKHKPKVSGYIQFWGRYSFKTSTDGMVDAPNFRVQRARVTLRGTINKYLGYKLEIDPRAPSITGVMRDAYIKIRKLIPHH